MIGSYKAWFSPLVQISLQSTFSQFLLYKLLSENNTEDILSYFWSLGDFGTLKWTWKWYSDIKNSDHLVIIIFIYNLQYFWSIEKKDDWIDYYWAYFDWLKVTWHGFINCRKLNTFKSKKHIMLTHFFCLLPFFLGTIQRK